jgi:hypothetical protein
MAHVKPTQPDLLRGVDTVHLETPREIPAPRVEVIHDPRGIPGTPEWFKFQLRGIRNTLKEADADCRKLAQSAPKVREYVETTLHQDWIEFCRTELESTAAQIEAIIEGVGILRGEGHKGPITKEQATTTAAKAQERGKSAEALPRPGNATSLRSEDGTFSKPDNVRDGSLGDKGGNSADYLASRLRRDHPAIADRLAAGEFKSVRAAAIEAGIVKPQAPEAQAARAVERSGDLAALADRLLDKVPQDRIVELMAMLIDRLPVDKQRKLLRWVQLALEGS